MEGHNPSGIRLTPLRLEENGTSSATSRTGVEGLEDGEDSVVDDLDEDGDGDGEIRWVGVAGRLLSADWDRLGKDGDAERPTPLTLGDGDLCDFEGLEGTEMATGVSSDLHLDATSLVWLLRPTEGPLFFWIFSERINGGLKLSAGSFRGAGGWALRTSIHKII